MSTKRITTARHGRENSCNVFAKSCRVSSSQEENKVYNCLWYFREGEGYCFYQWLCGSRSCTVTLLLFLSVSYALIWADSRCGEDVTSSNACYWKIEVYTTTSGVICSFMKFLKSTGWKDWHLNWTLIHLLQLQKFMPIPEDIQRHSLMPWGKSYIIYM